MRWAVPLRLLHCCWLLVTLSHTSSQTTTTNGPLSTPTLTTSGRTPVSNPTLTTSGTTRVSTPIITTSGTTPLSTPLLTTSEATPVYTPVLTTKGTTRVSTTRLTTSGTTRATTPSSTNSETTPVSTSILTTSGTTLVSTPLLPTQTTHSPTVRGTSLASTSKAGCRVISCENAGMFDEEFCECVCLPGYSGASCEVAPSKNPCVVDTSLCSGKGQYCEGDSSLPNGYECKCRTSDGYADDKKGGCTLKKAFKSKLRVTGINDKEVVYKPAYSDPNSAASQALFDVVIEVIEASLRKNEATKNFEEVKGVRLDEGSVIVTTVTIFPENDTVDDKGIETVLKADSLVDGNSSLALDKTNFEVEVSTTECQLTCFNRGPCEKSGYYPNYEYKCSCNRLFTGDSCEDLTELFIVLIAFIGFALLLGLVFLGVCLFKQIRQPRRIKPNGSFSGCESPNRRGSSSSGQTNHALEQDHVLGQELLHVDETRLSHLAECMNQSAHREQVPD